MTSPTALTQHAEMEFRMLSELSQPRSWERDVTKPEGEGKWKIRQSATHWQAFWQSWAVITFWSDLSARNAATRRRCRDGPLLTVLTHTDVQRRVIDVRARHTEMHKQIKRVKKVPRTGPLRLCYTELPAVGISQIRPPRKGSSGVASRQLIELKVFLARVEK